MMRRDLLPWVLSDANLGRQVLAREERISDPAILAGDYDEFKRQTPADLEPSRAGAENLLGLFPGGSMRIEDYIDTRLLDELNRQGFLAQMRRKYALR